MELAATFLNCKLGKIPFVYLGFSVDANIRRAFTWDPVVEVIGKTLKFLEEYIHKHRWKSDIH